MIDAGTTSRELYLRLLSYVRPHASAFGVAVLCMIAAAATEPLFPALMKPLLDGGFAAGQKPSLPPLLFAGALVGIFLLRGFLSLVSSYFLAWVSNRVVLASARFLALSANACQAGACLSVMPSSFFSLARRFSTTLAGLPKACGPAPGPNPRP